MSITKRFFQTSISALVLVTALAPMSIVKAESEETSDIDFWGQLIELSSTDVPTTIVVRQDPSGEFTDYTVDIDEETVFGTNDGNTTVMSDWITGDYLHVVGELNENTGVVTAETVVNSSLNPYNMRGLNGWIQEVDEDADTMTVQWNEEDHVVNITDDTHMVVGSTNPASLSDFVIGDRVRVRLEKDTEDARIVVVLRRGDEIYLKARTRGFLVELNDINEDDDDSGSLSVTLLENSHLRSSDVNNLVGEEGDELTIVYDENTNFVRRFMGSSEVDEFQAGDNLMIVGRVNDDGTISARLIKDNNIWIKGVARHTGEVDSVDTEENQIVMTPSDEEDAKYTSVTVDYDDDTVFMKDREEVTEDDLSADDQIRVRGMAREDDDALVITDVETIWIVTE